MDPFSAFAAVSAGLGALGGAAGNFIGGLQEQGAAKDNLRLQKENLAWQKESQAQTWAREDTAVQRRAADLKAAGMNPLLAAGGAAQSSSPVKTEAPQMDVRAAGGAARGVASGGSALSELALRGMQMRQDFAVKDASVQNMQAQNDLIRAQAEKTRVEANSIMSNMPLDVQRKTLENQFSQLANPQKLRAMSFELDQMNPKQLEDLNEQIRQRKASTLNTQEDTLWMQVQGSIRSELVRLGVDKAKQELIMQSLKNEFQGRSNQIQQWTMPAQVAGPYLDMTGNFKDLVSPRWKSR